MNFINEMMSKGPVAVMPIVFTLFGIFLGMPLKKAISGGLSIGIGFLGVSLVTNFISTTISDFTFAFSQLYNFNFSIVDVGWPKAAEIGFQSLIGLLIIPVCLGLNIVLLKFNLTNTINIDLWNYWHFSFLASVTYFVTQSLTLGLMMGCLDFLITNYLADITSKSVSDIYHMENISFPNSFAVSFIPLVYFFNYFLSKIGNNKKEVGCSNKRKNSWIPEPVLVSFIIGLVLALSIRYSVPETIYFAVVFSSMVLLIPIVSTLLGQGLKPIATIIGDRFRDKSNMNVGLTTVLVLGDKTIMLVFSILIPIALILSILIPKNQFFPAASLSGVVYLLPLIVSVCKRSVYKSTVISSIILVISFYFINLTSEMISKTAESMEIIERGIKSISSLDYGNSPLLVFLFVNMNLSNIIFGIILVCLMIIVIFLNKSYVDEFCITPAYRRE